MPKALLPVLRSKVVHDLRDAFLLDRRIRDFDHYVDLTLPALAIKEYRVHRYVVEAVARIAIGMSAFSEIGRVIVPKTARPANARRPARQGSGRGSEKLALRVYGTLVLISATSQFLSIRARLINRFLEASRSGK